MINLQQYYNKNLGCVQWFDVAAASNATGKAATLIDSAPDGAVAEVVIV
jgi:hypothetical protein